jgi:hypothetical protein
MIRKQVMIGFVLALVGALAGCVSVPPARPAAPSPSPDFAGDLTDVLIRSSIPGRIDSHVGPVSLAGMWLSARAITVDRLTEFGYVDGASLEWTTRSGTVVTVLLLRFLRDDGADRYTNQVIEMFHNGEQTSTTIDGVPTAVWFREARTVLIHGGSGLVAVIWGEGPRGEDLPAVAREQYDRLP